MLRWLTTLILLLTSSATIHAYATQPQHDKDFRRTILKQPRQSCQRITHALAHERSGMLASRDPELRDDLARSILDLDLSRQRRFHPNPDRTHGRLARHPEERHRRDRQ